MKKEKSNIKKTRQSNIELLRILAAMGVIFLHINNPNIGGGFRYAQNYGINTFIMAVFETVSICAVNLFVLISGYFLRTTRERDLLKPLELFARFFVFGLMFLLINEIPLGNGITFDDIVGYFMPSYWFVFVYSALYVISPYINIVWDHLDKSGRKILMTISIILFSVYPTLVNIFQYWSNRQLQGISTVGLEGSQAGYTIVNFVLMYLLGCAVRDMESMPETRKVAGLLIADYVAVILFTYIEMLGTGKEIFATTALNYDNPLIIAQAALVFLLFCKMNIGSNKVINFLGGASFPVYLIHINMLKWFDIETLSTGSPVLLIIKMILIAVGIYLFCTVIYFSYMTFTFPIRKALISNWSKGRKINIS